MINKYEVFLFTYSNKQISKGSYKTIYDAISRKNNLKKDEPLSNFKIYDKELKHWVD